MQRWNIVYEAVRGRLPNVLALETAKYAIVDTYKTLFEACEFNRLDVAAVVESLGTTIDTIVDSESYQKRAQHAQTMNGRSLVKTLTRAVTRDDAVFEWLADRGAVRLASYRLLWAALKHGHHTRADLIASDDHVNQLVCAAVTDGDVEMCITAQHMITPARATKIVKYLNVSDTYIILYWDIAPIVCWYIENIMSKLHDSERSLSDFIYEACEFDKLAYAERALAACPHIRFDDIWLTSLLRLVYEFDSAASDSRKIAITKWCIAHLSR